MARKLQLPASNMKAAHIEGAQFNHGLQAVKLSPDQFAKLFCNGRISRVHAWLNDEVPIRPWVPALLAAMLTPEARERAIATAEHLLGSAQASVGVLNTPGSSTVNRIGNTAFITTTPGYSETVVKPGQDAYVRVVKLAAGQQPPPGAFNAAEIDRIVGARIRAEQ